PAWFDGVALPAMDAGGGAGIGAPGGDDVRSLDALRRFLQAPADAFLRQRLGLRLAEVEEIDEDVEPLLAPGRGFARQALQRAVFDAVLRGDDDATTHALLRARGLLPSGPLGRRALEQMRGQVDPYALAFGGWRGDATADAHRLEVQLDGVTLQGRIADVYDHGIVRVRFDPPAGQSAIRNGLDWLLASATGLAKPLVEFHEDKELGAGPHLREPLESAQARALLRMLVGLQDLGLRQPQ